jgi:hypothetical protein
LIVAVAQPSIVAVTGSQRDGCGVGVCVSVAGVDQGRGCLHRAKSSLIPDVTTPTGKEVVFEKEFLFQFEKEKQITNCGCVSIGQSLVPTAMRESLVLLLCCALLCTAFVQHPSAT